MRLKKWLFSSLLVGLIVMFLPVIAFAEGNAEIQKFDIKAKVNTDGSLETTEKITYQFTGDVNGVFQVIKLAPGVLPENIVVSQNDKAFKLKQNAAKGDRGVFKFETIPDEKTTVWIYSPSSSGDEKTFTVSYKLPHAAVKGVDTSELYWKFIGNDWELNINNLTITVEFPDVVNESNSFIFAHGPLNGQIHFSGEKSVLMTVPFVPARQFVEARILFPKEYLSGVETIDNTITLTPILEEERGLAEKTRQDIEKNPGLVSNPEAPDPNLKLKNTIGLIISVLSVIGGFFIWRFLYRNYDKEYDTGVELDYYRELPEDVPPAVVGSLCRFKTVNESDLSATIMDLVRKGYIEIKTHSESKFLGLGKKDVHTLHLLRTDFSSLESFEKHLLDWFFQEIGNGTSVSMEDIEDYGKNNKSAARSFIANYERFQSQVVAVSETKDYFDESFSGKAGLYIALFVLTTIIGAAVSFTLSFSAIFLPIVSVILMFYVAVGVKRRTKNGAKLYQQWQAFRKFLLDFSNMKEASLESLVLWEHYLVYALPLGVADKVLKQLKVSIPTEQMETSYMDMYIRYQMYNIIFSSISHSVSSGMRTSQTTLKPPSTGSGGGFSSGGGFGGGGGGGGTF